MYVYVHLLIIIIQLLLSVALCTKEITISGFHSKQVLRSTILSSTILSFFFDNSRIGRF
jgi:hypothetical protein